MATVAEVVEFRILACECVCKFSNDSFLFARGIQDFMPENGTGTLFAGWPFMLDGGINSIESYDEYNVAGLVIRYLFKKEGF